MGSSKLFFSFVRLSMFSFFHEQFFLIATMAIVLFRFCANPGVMETQLVRRVHFVMSERPPKPFLQVCNHTPSQVASPPSGTTSACGRSMQLSDLARSQHPADCKPRTTRAAFPPDQVFENLGLSEANTSAAFGRLEEEVELRRAADV